MFSCELCLYELRVGSLFIHLIDGNDNLRVRFTGETNRFDSLRLHAVVCCDDNNHDIGQGCTVLTKCREGFVARCIKQRDHTIILFYLIGRNVLCNATCFTIDGLCFKNSVKKARFTVVNVTHDGDDWWTIDSLVAQRVLLTNRTSRNFFLLQYDVETELFNNNRRGFKVDLLIDRRHNTVLKQLADQRCN